MCSIVYLYFNNVRYTKPFTCLGILLLPGVRVQVEGQIGERGQVAQIKMTFLI